MSRDVRRRTGTWRCSPPWRQPRCSGPPDAPPPHPAGAGCLADRGSATAEASTTPPAERTQPGAGRFAGKWFVHGSSMVIGPNGRASIVSNVGPCRRPVRGRAAMCSERTSYRFALSADGTALTGRLTAIGFETWEGQKVPKSVVGYSTPPGSATR